MKFKAGDKVKSVITGREAQVMNVTNSGSLLVKDNEGTWFYWQDNDVQRLDSDYDVKPFYTLPSNPVFTNNSWNGYWPSPFGDAYVGDYGDIQDDKKEESKRTKCECGQASVESTWGVDPKAHSDYCPIYKENK